MTHEIIGYDAEIHLIRRQMRKKDGSVPPFLFLI